MKQLRSYQKTAFERFWDSVFFCLNFACGLGKTFTAALIAKKKNMPTMIIAPNSLCEQWYDELVEMGVSPDDIFIANAPEENRDPEGYMKRFEQWLSK